MGFVEIKGRSINLANVRDFRFALTERELHITYADGSKEAFAEIGLESGIPDIMTRTPHIVQVIPCAAPLYAVYEKTGCKEEFFCSPVHFVALCADNEVRPLTLCEGRFGVDAAGDGNCCGVVEKDRLPAWGITLAE